MARPRLALPPVGQLLALVDAEGRIMVRVTPGVRAESLEIAGVSVSIKVRARPEDGKANEAVRQLLATALDLPPTRLVLVRGATAREKQFRILP